MFARSAWLLVALHVQVRTVQEPEPGRRVLQPPSHDGMIPACTLLDVKKMLVQNN